MVEGAPLLRAYTLTGIVGSNPILFASRSCDDASRAISTASRLIALTSASPLGSERHDLSGRALSVSEPEALSGEAHDEDRSARQKSSAHERRYPLFAQGGVPP